MKKTKDTKIKRNDKKKREWYKFSSYKSILIHSLPSPHIVHPQYNLPPPHG